MFQIPFQKKDKYEIERFDFSKVAFKQLNINSRELAYFPKENFYFKFKMQKNEGRVIFYTI